MIKVDLMETVTVVVMVQLGVDLRAAPLAGGMVLRKVYMMVALLGFVKETDLVVEKVVKKGALMGGKKVAEMVAVKDVA